MDCAYLVTMGDSPHVAAQIRRLTVCSEQVVVLHTVDADPLSREFPDVSFVRFAGQRHQTILEKPSSFNPTLTWNRTFDIPSKRSFAIEHAKRSGFEYVFLVDDDVLFRRTFVPSALDALRRGADIACSYALYYADVSTMERVRHEQTGEPPEVSISGNGMILKVGPRLGIFPYIYNEDWLFFWSSIRYGRARVEPVQNVTHRRPRPGRNTLVGMEQFGELVVFLLFFHDGANSELSRLQEIEFVRDGMAAYRSRLTVMLTGDEHGRIVEQALSAFDAIQASDVCDFSACLEREIKQHYGSEVLI